MGGDEGQIWGSPRTIGARGSRTIALRRSQQGSGPVRAQDGGFADHHRTFGAKSFLSTCSQARDKPANTKRRLEGKPERTPCGSRISNSPTAHGHHRATPQSHRSARPDTCQLLKATFTGLPGSELCENS